MHISSQLVLILYLTSARTFPQELGAAVVLSCVMDESDGVMKDFSMYVSITHYYSLAPLCVQHTQVTGHIVTACMCVCVHAGS